MKGKKENILETFELELLSNRSSNTEIEQDTTESNLRRSKRLTKTNLIVRLNNPVPSDYSKYVKRQNDRESAINLENNRESDESPCY